LGKVPRLKAAAKQAARYETLWIGLETDRDTLRKRINARLLKRMEGSRMLREVESLRKKGVSWKRLHDFGLEYRHLALLLRKKTTKEAMLTALEQDISNFAKRQMTWFKRNKDIHWLPIGSGAKAAALVRRFAR
jgi:tRNA dimethylallyltransferase